MRSLLCTVAILAISTVAGLQTNTGVTNAPIPATCTGVVNPHPINTAAPTFVKNVTNGKMYTAGTGNDTFNIIHVWGTPYQQGFANGEASKEGIVGVWKPFLAYIDAEIENKIHSTLPVWLLDLFNKYGLEAVLDWSVEQTKPFTPQRYLDEMQGVADGANVSVKLIERLNAFPEVTKAACTIVGATGSATPSGKISHLRGLDFSPRMPIRDYPQVTVYHNDGAAGQSSVVNVGWAGLIGSLTGISNQMISIGEKVWLHQEKLEGSKGQPWMLILRDVLMTKNMTQALDTMINANRTCAIHVGVGDSTTNTFRGVTMVQKQIDIYNSTSLEWEGHPLIDDVFYWNKHGQPSHVPCLGDLLNQYHGNLDAETMAIQVAPVTATGDMHCVTFDLNTKVSFVANARKSTAPTDGHLEAYTRQFTKLNLTDLFAETL